MSKKVDNSSPLGHNNWHNSIILHQPLSPASSLEQSNYILNGSSVQRLLSRAPVAVDCSLAGGSAGVRGIPGQDRTGLPHR
ncbi:unnamed protein product, partial [Nesidiocoris tenuis]